MTQLNACPNEILSRICFYLCPHCQIKHWPHQVFDLDGATGLQIHSNSHLIGLHSPLRELCLVSNRLRLIAQPYLWHTPRILDAHDYPAIARLARTLYDGARGSSLGAHIRVLQIWNPATHALRARRKLKQLKIAVEELGLPTEMIVAKINLATERGEKEEMQFPPENFERDSETSSHGWAENTNGSDDDYDDDDDDSCDMGYGYYYDSSDPPPPPCFEDFVCEYALEYIVRKAPNLETLLYSSASSTSLLAWDIQTHPHAQLSLKTIGVSLCPSSSPSDASESYSQLLPALRMAAPNLRELQLQLNSTTELSPPEFSFPTVEKLTLVAIYPEQQWTGALMARLIEAFPALTDFSFFWAMDSLYIAISYPYQPSPKALLNVGLAKVHHQLRRLALCSENFDLCAWPYPFPDLHDFTALQVLEIDTCASGSSIQLNGSAGKDTNCAELVRIIPPSIREIWIRSYLGLEVPDAWPLELGFLAQAKEDGRVGELGFVGVDDVLYEAVGTELLERLSRAGVRVKGFVPPRLLEVG